ncbi:hypothetical protein, partial [Campylobacter coli]|uniref:hypothetical protein n=1 Tax=Campylobacter coli TaxID=195 RepID=UPI001C92C784
NNMENNNCHIMPNLAIPNSVPIKSIVFFDILEEILNTHLFIDILRLNIDRENYNIVLDIIYSKKYKNIKYIICEINDIIINEKEFFRELYGLIKEFDINNIFFDNIK